MSLTQSVKLRDLYCFSKSSKVCCRQLASRAMFAGQILRDPGVDKKLSHTSKGVSLGRPRLATNPTRLFEFKLSALVFRSHHSRQPPSFLIINKAFKDAPPQITPHRQYYQGTLLLLLLYS